MRAAQKLVGVPTIGRGKVRAGGGGGGSQRSQIRPHATRNVQKTAKNWAVSHTFWPVNCRKQRFLLKST
jgi:hypothetical protein